MWTAKYLYWPVMALATFVAGDSAPPPTSAVRTEYVFRKESPQGRDKIKTLQEAEAICRESGAVIAKIWQLRDAVRFRNYYICGCGWLELGKNASPRCGNEEAFYTDCAATPEKQGQEGYDVYCYGSTPPELPPDAVPINTAKDKGYVFIVRHGELIVIENESKAKDACRRRQANLATNDQVIAAWTNGLSQCECAWMDGYQSMVMRDTLIACGNQSKIIPCHHGDLNYSLCFVGADTNPVGVSTVDFSSLGVYVFPVGVEEGATKIKGGYVYPTMGSQGDMRTPNIFWAHETCRGQGASVATPDQLKEALSAGMTWCKCGWVWENAALKFGVMVEGSGGVMYPTKNRNDVCGRQTGLIRCPLKNPNGDGWNVFCYKQCPGTCPSDNAWKIPANSVPIPGGRVYLLQHKDGQYRLGSSRHAERECGRLDSELATMAQLAEAARNGMTQCQCGYTADGQAAFPMFRPIASCGKTSGVLPCPGDYADIPEKGPYWDAYCFIKDEKMNKKSSLLDLNVNLGK